MAPGRAMVQIDRRAIAPDVSSASGSGGSACPPPTTLPVTGTKTSAISSDISSVAIIVAGR